MKPTKSQLKKIERITKKIAWQAGQVTLKYWRKEMDIKLKAHTADIVTAADFATEKAIMKGLKKYFPDLRDKDFLWLIDPIDGTLAFSRGLPRFSVSMGLFHKEKPLCGVVYDPTMNEMFSAACGLGAYLNGRKIRVSNTKSLTKSQLVSGFPYQRHDKIFEKEVFLTRKFMQKSQYVYLLPSAAVSICYVACGRLDGYFEMRLKSLDYAGGMVVLREAGGICSQTNGKPLTTKRVQSFLGTNPFIYKKMLKITK
jgi:myo-inositol-1(or 4)-monophosphatase